MVFASAASVPRGTKPTKNTRKSVLGTFHMKQSLAQQVEKPRTKAECSTWNILDGTDAL
jgi:hypothetical protein